MQLLRDGESVLSCGLEARPAAAMRVFKFLNGRMSIRIGDVRDRPVQKSRINMAMARTDEDVDLYYESKISGVLIP